MRSVKRAVSSVLVLFFSGAAFLSLGQIYERNLPLDHPAIRYTQGELDDPVTRLTRRLDQGARLAYDAEGFGYLPGLLDQLGIHTDSQALVFSKTSLQADKI